MKKAPLIISGVVCLGLLGSTPFAFRRFFEAKMNPDGSSWMSELADTKAVSLLSIPGSHDSGSTHSIADVAGICQDLKISEQLSAGVRFFDIRLRAVHDELIVCHGFIDQGAKFGDVRAAFTSFLKEHPEEGLFVSVKEEQKAQNCTQSFETLLLNEINQDSYWSLNNEIPKTLGEIRGKAVLISRYRDPSIGIFAFEGWKDNPAEYANTFEINIDVGTLCIQDHYKFSEIDTKKKEFQAMLDETSAYNEIELAADVLLGRQKLYLNFASGYLEGAFPPSYSLTVAPEMNQYVAEAAKNVNSTGIVILDFVTPELCQSIYEVNSK